MTVDPEALAACADEPIHIPGSIQPHGLLVAFAPDTREIVAESANAATMLGHEGRLAGALSALPAEIAVPLGELLDRWQGRERSSSQQGRVAIAGRSFDAALHDSDGLAVVELETAPAESPPGLDALYASVGEVVDEMERLSEVGQVALAAVRRIRRMTGYDRVLAYRFDEDGHGTVIAEDCNDRLPSYLGHRFPGTDVPAQARDLYVRNRLRHIPDAYYTPVPVHPDRNPRTGRPLDLSHAVLRSVSPVHVEYMRNMGTGASMSASLVIEGRLWGLVSCHNAQPRQVPMQVRDAVGIVARILSVQIASGERARRAVERFDQKTILSRILHTTAQHEDVAAGLAAAGDDLLAQTGADSAVIVRGDEILHVGPAPDDAAVREIIEWLTERGGEEIYATDRLSEEMPGADRFAGQASGLLVAAISSVYADYILWFRQEQVRTVTWGGDPRKPASGNGSRLSPRASFAAWRDETRGTSAPWRSSEIEAVEELRTALLGIVLRQAEERARLTGQLQATNRELEAFSYSISHDLRAPFRHIVGFAELLREHATDLDETSLRYVATIVEAASTAGRLVDDLLRFSQLGRTSLDRRAINLDKLVDEVRQTLLTEGGGQVKWEVEPLPTAIGDATLVRQVVYNLLSNAVKYSARRDEPRIEIRGWREGNRTVLSVKDNGAGFEMAYAHKLFGVFQRLHHVDEFDGTGIGLAIVRRIVERHGGKVWAEGVVDQGAHFTVALPDSGETA